MGGDERDRRGSARRKLGEHVQVLELLIFAALAAAVLYQLYAVLGRRVGRNAEDTVRAPALVVADTAEALRRDADDVAAPSGLVAMRAADPSFDPNTFLQGAGQAYEMIVRAFAAGDRDALARLVSADVLAAFGRVIDQRQAEGRSETIEFSTPPRADIEALGVDGGVARAKVRFLAEFRSRGKGPEGESVDDRRTAEFWTFERRLANRDPNWLLTRVDAAEA
jgi:predicted lipid-binding transport protein (Tim44 family)